MFKLLIVSHMPTDNLHAMTRAVVDGASNEAIEEVDLDLKQALQTGPEDVLNADAIILGTSENFGYMSGGMKDFFDRIYYPCLDKTESLPYAMFIRAGNDGLGAQSSIERIAKGLGWKMVQAPLICRGRWQDSFLEECENLGMTLAAGLEAGVF